jgi:hypothetical protein
LQGIHLAKSDKQETIRSIMKWTDMNEALAEGSYEMAARVNPPIVCPPRCLQIAMEEIRSERRLEVTPDPAAAFDFTSYRAALKPERQR